MTIRLHEATTSAPQIKGSKWRAKIINEGKGSSATYPAAVLKEFGPTAWPQGTHVFLNHLGEGERDERSGSHDIRDLVGVFESTPEFVESDGGLYAEIKFFEKHRAFMEEIAPYVGLSIEANGEVDDDGNVTSLIESPLNAVSVVPRAGRGGKLLELVESFREAESDRMNPSDKGEPNGSPAVPERKPMNEQEIKALAEALAAAIKPEFAALTEALTPKPVETPKDEPDFAAVVEAAVEADLSKSSRARVVEAVKSGKDLNEALATEKSLKDEILAEAEQSGFVVKGTSSVSLEEQFNGLSIFGGKK